MRAVAPAASATSRGGTPSALAMSRTSASLASPSLRRGAHARLQHRAAVAHLLDAVDGVAPTFGRQPHGQRHAAGRRRLHGFESRLEDVGIDVADDDVLDQQDDQDQDHRRNVDAAKLGIMLRIGRSTGSVMR